VTFSETGLSRRTGARYWVALAVTGAIGGILSGAFGVGGGILMVPLLIGLAGMDQKRASATSLAAILPTALAGSITYFVNGEVDLVVALLVAIGGVAGSYLGARLLRRIPVVWLRWAFILLLIGVAIRMFLIAPERGAEVQVDFGVGLALVAAGLFMGVASGLFGIGGGVILVPLLIAGFGSGDLIAKGTSLAVMVPTSLMGTLTNVRGGMVDVRAGAVVGVAAVLASFVGVALAFLVPPGISGVLFAILLVVSAAQLTIRAIRLQLR
jgi:uncharacterized membrane protein YfcA